MEAIRSIYENYFSGSSYNFEVYYPEKKQLEEPPLITVSGQVHTQNNYGTDSQVANFEISINGVSQRNTSDVKSYDIEGNDHVGERSYKMTILYRLSKFFFSKILIMIAIALIIITGVLEKANLILVLIAIIPFIMSFKISNKVVGSFHGER
ncbi:MAG: hypothetical protein ABF539_08220 [Liquorilactobacillus nagelii]|uniref:hypothetical protein n=1 Tax=Liquorilactobacillus nagelii TaxID=82688 RepID=UPI0039E9964A